MKRTLYRTHELAELGYSRWEIPNIIKQGKIEKVSRGLYRRADAEITENYSLAAVVKIFPRGILCLLTALRYHGIGTQDPPHVWVAVPIKTKPPKIIGLPVKMVTFSGASLTSGVIHVKIDGIPAHITNPARTVIDCFRYRNKIGIDVALEALREGLRQKKISREDLRNYAQRLRAWNVIQPYIEAYSA